MEIADNWSTEYNRKGFRVVLQEADWASLLIDAGVHPETVLPLAAKFQLLKLQAAIFSLEAMASAACLVSPVAVVVSISTSSL